MAAAVPIIGSIITSIVVSRAASVIATKLGMSEDMAGLIGVVAGGYAGAATYTAATAAQTGATAAAGSEAAAAAMPNAPVAPSTGVGAPAPSAPGLMQQGVDPGLAHAVDKVAPLPAAPAATEATASRGLLSQGTGNVASEAPATTQPSADTAKDIIKTETVDRTAGGSGTSYWEKLFPADRLTDMAVAGIGSMAKSEQDDKAYDRDKADGMRWGQQYGNRVNTLNKNYPTTGG